MYLKTTEIEMKEIDELQDVLHQIQEASLEDYNSVIWANEMLQSNGEIRESSSKYIESLHDKYCGEK